MFVLNTKMQAWNLPNNWSGWSVFTASGRCRRNVVSTSNQKNSLDSALLWCVYFPPKNKNIAWGPGKYTILIPEQFPECNKISISKTFNILTIFALYYIYRNVYNLLQFKKFKLKICILRFILKLKRWKTFNRYIALSFIFLDQCPGT